MYADIDKITIHCTDTEDGSFETVGPYFGNFITSGLMQFGFRELCIPFYIERDKAILILNNLISEIIDTGDLRIDQETGLIHNYLKNGYDLKVYGYGGEDGDYTLYIFIPDINNKFPGDEDCDPVYRAQWYYADTIHDNRWYE